MSELIRLQVYLSHAGIASRRASEKLIRDGKVSVNGIVVTQMGVKVAQNDIVSIEGREVFAESKFHYIAMNKPVNYISSSSDSEGRPLALDLLPANIKERLYNVGRLDYQSCGLLLFTNDGEFAAKISHPSSEIEKEYYVESTGIIDDEVLYKFETGIEIENIVYKCKKIQRLEKRAVKIVLVEGKNKEIRRVFSFFHLHPRILRRIRIGNVLLGDLGIGKTRQLTDFEKNSLLKVII